MLFDKLRVIADPIPRDGPYNMALDEVLLQRTALPTLRLYRWSAQWISLGYFSRLAEAEMVWPESPKVRRWTGGGLVDHQSDFTFSVIVPAGLWFATLPSRDTYRLLHEHVRNAIDPSGKMVSLSEAPQASVSGACFQNAVEHDLLTATGKVAGGAQRRSRGALLHQGSILMAEIPEDLGGRLGALLGACQVADAPSPEERDLAIALAETRYATRDWLERY